ncbi:MAG TPA: HIT domain-containing protein [Methylovirgula sp.]
MTPADLDTEYDDNNIFAKILRGEMPCHKIYEDDVAFAFMDIMPRTKGHCLVIPKFACRNLFDADPDGLGALIQRVQKIARAARTAFAADGLTLHQFNEQAGGQVIFHMHFHILPRFAGVELLPPASGIESPQVLEANAAKIAAAIG